MKRFLIIAAVLMLLLLFAGCEKNEPTSPTDAATEAPTDAPYIDTQINEPEWTLAEGVLQLETDDKVYASGDDILYFAIVTNDDGSQELRFRLSDETAATLKALNADNHYFITLNNEKIGNAKLNDECTVATVSETDAESSITELASKIRGLS